eukprot:5099889-Karenia_brevis.AAC.1
MQPSQLVMRRVGIRSVLPQPAIHQQYSLQISILKTSKTQQWALALLRAVLRSASTRPSQLAMRV